MKTLLTNSISSVMDFECHGACKPMIRFLYKVLYVILSAMLLLLGVNNSNAQYVWDVTNFPAGDVWSNSFAGWQVGGGGPDVVWSNSQNAVIPLTSVPPVSQMVFSVATVTTGSINFQSGVSNLLIDNNLGDVMTVTGGISISGPGTSVVAGNNLRMILQGAGIVSGATGTITFQTDSILNPITAGAISGGTVRLTQLSTLSVGATNALTTGANVQFGTSGSGTLKLNSFNTTIGTLSSTTSGGGIIENGGASNATLTTNLTGTSTFSGIIKNGSSGTFALVTQGNGTLGLRGANTYTGGTTIGSGGTVIAQSSSALGVGNVVANGTLKVQTSTLGIASLAGTRLLGSGTIENGGATNSTLKTSQAVASTFSGTLINGGSGTLALEMAGTGALTLSGANTYTGGTTIDSGGTIVAANNSALGRGNVTANGTLRVRTSNLTIASLAGAALSGNGLIENGGATNSTLTMAQTVASTFSGVIANGGSGTLGLNVAGGAGVLTLTGTNSYSGGTTVANGTVITKNDSALGIGSVISNGTLRVQTNNLTVASSAGASLSGSGLIENGGTTNSILTTNQIVASTFSGLITNGGSGTLALNIGGNGSLALTNANSYTGGTTIGSGGAIVVMNNSALGTGSAVVNGTLKVQTGNLTVASSAGSSLTGNGIIETGSVIPAILTVDQSTTSAFAGTIVDGGVGELTLNKINSGKLILTNTNTYTGGTNVIGGTLALNNGGQISGNAEVFSGATLTSSSGSGTVLNDVTIDNGGNLTVQVGNLLTVGNLTFTSTSNFNAGLAGPSTTSLINVGTIAATGNLALNGFLNITDEGGFGGVGSYRLFNYNGALSGSGFTVTTVPNGVYPGDLSLDLSTSGEVNLIVSSPAGPGGLSLQYWDGSVFVFNKAVDGGNGIWNNVSTNWTSAGGNLNIPWGRSGAVFAGKSGNVVLGDNILFGGLFFMVDGYTISSPGFVLSPVGNALVQVVGGATATINAPLVGSGTITKYDTGTLNVAGAPSSIGGLTVREGKVLVNTILRSPSVVVQQGGALGGNGVIVGNVTNDGVLSPGNSVGLLAIDGNYTQTSSGTFQLEIAGLNAFDQLVVNGAASLDGTVEVVPLEGFQLAPAQRFTFLAANGGINGNFTRITGLPDGLRGILLETPNTVTLVLGFSNYTLAPNLTQNQRNIAQALTQCFGNATSGDRFFVDVVLAQLPFASYGAIFDQIGPAFYESFSNTLIEQSNALGQFLEQRFDAVRLGGRGFTSYGFVGPKLVEGAGKSYLGKDYKEGKDILVATPENRWGVWVQGNGIFARNRSVNSVPSYRNASGGFVGGADYQWLEGLATGLYSGYQGTYSKYQNRGRAIINGVNFGSYASYNMPGSGFYADGLVGGNFSSFNVRRPIKFGPIDRVATSKPNSGGLTTLLATGYDIEVSNFTIGPIVSGQYSYVGMGDFTERGADSLNLKVRHQNANSLRTSVGGRVAYTWNVTDQIMIIPEGRMSWQHEFLQYPRTVNSALDAGTCPWFAYSTASPNRDAVFAGAGLIVQLGRHLNLNAYYNADFGRRDYVAHMISGGVNVEF